jgi:hypothetical protein
MNYRYPLFLLTQKAQKKKLGKKKTPKGDFARCDERPPFRRRHTTNFFVKSLIKNFPAALSMS